MTPPVESPTDARPAAAPTPPVAGCDVDAMEKAAKALPSHPWRIEPSGFDKTAWDVIARDAPLHSYAFVEAVWREVADHLAAAQPANVLALIAHDRAETARADAAEVQLAASRAQVEALVAALRPFAVHIPDRLPDTLWTSCDTETFDLTPEELALLSKVATVMRPVQQYVLWMDGHPLADFRTAAGLVADHDRACDASLRAGEETA